MCRHLRLNGGDNLRRYRRKIIRNTPQVLSGLSGNIACRPDNPEIVPLILLVNFVGLSENDG